MRHWLRRLLGLGVEREAPAPRVSVYLTNQAMVDGQLIATYPDALLVGGQVCVQAEGESRPRRLDGPIRIARERVEFYTLS
jgi:hypothetical protein